MTRKLGILVAVWCVCAAVPAWGVEVNELFAAGSFYPGDPQTLAQNVDRYLVPSGDSPVPGKIFALIVPHAGYDYSGPTAGQAYSLIKGKAYTSAIILFPSHRIPLQGAAVAPEGVLRTPLGRLGTDEPLRRALEASGVLREDPRFFLKEHALEVQLPFLQRALPSVSVVPVAVGRGTFEELERIASALHAAIGARKDVLAVVSTDLYHGYDPQELQRIDDRTLGSISAMDPRGLYDALQKGNAQMCGGEAAVVGMLLSGLQGHRHAYIIARTDSGKVGGRPEKGKWTVGYASIAIDQVPGGKDMLTSGQRKELLEIARSSIRQFLETGKRSAVRSTDPLLAQVQGAFVTLHRKGQLRGCIGTIVGQKPLYVTVRDMAVEAATGDPRFPKVTLAELGELEIEISVLSPLRRVAGAADIELGTHGVLVRKGAQSGVFLPQVAQETNWSKEEFLSYLCTHKAFLPADAWKDASTELYVFTAEVFSEHGA